MRIGYSLKADQEITDILLRGIVEFGERQAKSYLERFRNLERLLRDNPEMGRPYPHHDLTSIRRIRVGSHIVFYKLDDDDIIIGRVIHGRMNLDEIIEMNDFLKHPGRS